MVKSWFSKKAFSLIELIFAIVVMGITVVSLPVVMNSNDKGLSATVTQEAIFGASAELNMILSYRWDENSLDDTINSNVLTEVINPGDCNNTNTSSRFRLRPGHIEQPLHRRCLENLTTTISTLGADADLDDVDDINTTAKSIFINDPTTTAGYKTDYKSDVNITYSTMGGLVNAADAKYIEVTVKDGNTVITKLRSYTLNIGEVDIYKKTY